MQIIKMTSRYNKTKNAVMSRHVRTEGEKKPKSQQNVASLGFLGVAQAVTIG